MTQLISTIAVAMGASWVSGINLYATVATLGLLSRFAHLRLPGELEVLTSWWVIGVAVVLYLIEFFADKIPIVDSTWDGDRPPARWWSCSQLSRHQGRNTSGLECES
jgi:hypothetical protein